MIDPTIIRIGEIDKAHLVVEGVSLCGRVFDDDDLHEVGAGLRVWFTRQRCRKCVEALHAREAHELEGVLV